MGTDDSPPAKPAGPSGGASAGGDLLDMSGSQASSGAKNIKIPFAVNFAYSMPISQNHRKC